MIDETSQKKLARLYPPFAEKLRQLINVLGHNWRILEGFRSFEEQSAFFAQGRSRPGGLITRDRAGYSGHNYGVVAHIAPTVDGQVAWDDNEAFLRLTVEAKKVGLASGGTWGSKFLEKSRVEMVILTMDESLALFKKGQLPAVWAAFDMKLRVVVVPEPPTEPELIAEVEVDEIAPVPEEPVVAAPEPPKKLQKSPVVLRREKAAKKGRK